MLLPDQYVQKTIPIVFFKFFTHGTGIEKTWSSFQFVVISNMKFYIFFHKLPTMETELLLYCSFNAYRMKLDRWMNPSQEPLYKSERAETSPLSSIVSLTLFHVSSILWVVRFSKKMGIIFNYAITILTKARTWTVRKKNPGTRNTFRIKIPTSDYLKFYLSLFITFQKDCFIQTLNWLKVLYCRHRLVAYWVPFPLPYNLWLLSEDFPEHFPSLGIVTERMRYLRYTSPKRVTDFKLEWFLSLAHSRGKFKSLSCKLFIPFSPHCCHTS